MDEAGVTAGIVAAFVTIVEIVKYLITRFIPQKPNLPKTELQERDATRDGVRKLVTKVDRLWEVHSEKDSDGIPMCYVPRAWMRTQHEISESIRGISESQRRIIEVLERLERDRAFSNKIARVRAETSGEET